MHTIKILGVRDHSGTSQLYSNVQNALLGLNLKLEPALIEDVDQLIGHKVGGIPALMVRGQVVAQRHIPDEGSLQHFFKTIFLPEKNPIKMKNILIPTDFSVTSSNAFAFAKELAARSQASMKLVHVHYPEVTAVEAAPVDMFAESLNWKKDRIQDFAKQTTSETAEEGMPVLTKITTDVTIGFPGESIVDLSKQDDVDLIVMGTTGESGVLEKVFGSISSHVARKAHCPVLLVPDGVRFKECQNILFATDKKAADEILIENIPYLLTCPNANVHFAHVNETEGKEYKVENLSFFNPELTGQFHFVDIESDNVFDGLNRYAKEQGVDAMVMVTARRPFFEELFHKSMTKQMALNTKMPLLVMHYGD